MSASFVDFFSSSPNQVRIPLEHPELYPLHGGMAQVGAVLFRGPAFHLFQINNPRRKSRRKGRVGC